tara:strand:+ start:351 stop:713 length:363 start_codon:yes stop_codon:yes gene_type:complete
MAKKTTKSAEEIAAEASKKEMEAKREEITAYYKDSIKHLKVQLEYEDLLMNIEKARAERVQAQMFLAQAMAKNEEETAAKQPQQPQGQPIQLKKGVSNAGSDWDATSDKAPPVRKLKTVE